MNKWWLAMRPKTLIASISPVLIGFTLALCTGNFSLLTLLFTLLTAIGIQIGTNLTNDYVDYTKGTDTANRQGPLRVTQAGLVSVPVMKRATLLTFSLTALCGSYLIWQGGLLFALLLGISIMLGYIYTAGPFPLAYLGLGELFVLPFFGPIATLGTYLLQTGTFSWVALLAGLAPGSISCVILAINNLRDYEEDLAANKKTLVVRFGMTFGRFECLLFFTIAFLTALFLSPLALLAFVFAIKPTLPKTAALLATYTLLFCIGILL